LKAINDKDWWNCPSRTDFKWDKTLKGFLTITEIRDDHERYCQTLKAFAIDSEI